MHAAAKGKLCAVRFLLDEGADASTLNNLELSALDLAVNAREARLGERLKEGADKGRSWEEKDEYDSTALHLESQLNDLAEIVELLKKAEAARKQMAGKPQ